MPLPNKKRFRIVGFTVALLVSCIAFYSLLIGMEEYSAREASRILESVERLKPGDASKDFEIALQGCQQLEHTTTETECWITAGAFRFHTPWLLLQKLPDSWYYGLVSVANRLGLRYWRLGLSSSTLQGRIIQISVNLYVVGRYEALGARWVTGESIPSRFITASVSDADKRTDMHWYHITSLPSGEGFMIYTTKESTETELRARRINRTCLFSFRGCDGLCELLPDAIPLLNERHRSWGGCCSVPRSWCDLKNDDCGLGFR